MVLLGKVCQERFALLPIRTTAILNLLSSALGPHHLKPHPDFWPVVVHVHKLPATVFVLHISTAFVSTYQKRHLQLPQMFLNRLSNFLHLLSVVLPLVPLGIDLQPLQLN